MKLQVKSNGNVVELKKELYDKLPADQKLNYNVLSAVDAAEKKDEVVKNETPKPAKEVIPASGEKK